ncbi:C-type lectin domain family 4 member M-like [Megalobrama amblycephala]|uniref:C-type lectin domain family 4 member M-like n=1 Tax=Megalobrama amblycephala TaxID=75352 RepID=UPI002013E495|nr:C-type lectin domain family 4 member M-like [Megalobrama amblycephala]
MSRKDGQTTNIYENDDVIKESDNVKIRSSRAAAVCLVLLCVLLLTAVIVLCVHIHTKSSNYTPETHQLLTNITNLTEERDGLKIKIKNLTIEREQLKLEKNDLQMSLGKLAEGWVYNQSSFYFISSEKKNWTESRRYCTERGADLIIINNREEQEFVKNSFDRFWIGLTDSDVEDRWKWVDGSALTSGIWRSGQPDNYNDEDCAFTSSTGWFDYPCKEALRWICEKIIFK